MTNGVKNVKDFTDVICQGSLSAGNHGDEVAEGEPGVNLPVLFAVVHQLRLLLVVAAFERLRVDPKDAGP